MIIALFISFFHNFSSSEAIRKSIASKSKIYKHVESKKFDIDFKKLQATTKGPIGYIKKPTFIQGNDPSSFNEDDGKLHVIFSSGCNYFQHWQSELLLASALLAGQHGRLTRIVSGCYDKSAETAKHKHQTFPGGKNDKIVPLSILNRSINSNFGLFITPEFEGAVDFPWINKPSSINFFMKYARKELDKFGESVIAIIDPDFIFLKPLTQRGESDDEIIATRGQIKDDIVKKGHPVAQRYGLEDGWVRKFHSKIEEITGNPNSLSKSYTSKEARKWTSVGPPMLLHIDDITNLAELWEHNMRPVLQIGGPDILADMWAYSIASADLELKHTTLDHFMISTWGTQGQAYPFIDQFMSMSCNKPFEKHTEDIIWPTFIHLASNFKAFDEDNKEWMFHKGHVPGNILDCDMPLIIEPPDNLFNINRDSTDPKVYQKAWVVCNTISRINQVLLLYKQKFCVKEGYEERNLIKLIQKKSRDRGCSARKDKWCFPLAQIEGLEDNWRDNL